MEWNESLMATGVDIVDEQHREIIRRVNNLTDAVNAQREPDIDEINKLIDFLADYVIAHFLSEESLQMKIDYSDYPAHKEEHEDFIHRFVDMRDEYQSSGAKPENIQKLTEICEAWLIEHIASSDTRFAAKYHSWKN